MSHSGHGGGHGDMPMDDMCSMNMLWNTDIINTCIVFKSWHIRSHAAFALSFLVIVGLGVLFEYLRAVQRSLDVRVARQIKWSAAKQMKSPTTPGPRVDGGDGDEVLLLGSTASRTAIWPAVPLPSRIARALVYGATIFLSFFLMLVFMTYNAYLILAVVLGAVTGHYTFGARMDVDAVLAGSADGKGMACH